MALKADSGMVLGEAFGIVFGIVFGHMVLGMIFGSAFGLDLWSRYRSVAIPLGLTPRQTPDSARLKADTT